MARRGRSLNPRQGRMPDRRTYGHYLGQGPLARDDRTGWLFPIAWMVRQCGLLVSRDPNDGSYDRVEPADKPFCRPTAGSTGTAAASPPPYAALPPPLCLFHFDVPTGFLTDSGTKGFHLSLEDLGEG